MANLLSLILPVIALLIAITIHEFSHAFVADRLGDPTPRSLGRLSLNPLAHLDPLGTVMLILIHFGWGKPVPIDPYNLNHPRRDELLIALAGPGSNLLLAAVLSIILRFIFADYLLTTILSFIIMYNVYLAIFNLIPIPPLDGSKIFLNLLPADASVQWERTFDQYGPFLLILLLFLPINGSNIITLIISPIINTILPVLLPRGL